jgi:hypothetical protein
VIQTATRQEIAELRRERFGSRLVHEAFGLKDVQ